MKQTCCQVKTVIELIAVWFEGRWDLKKKISQAEVEFIQRMLLIDDRSSRDVLTKQLMSRWNQLRESKERMVNTFITEQGTDRLTDRLTNPGVL